jgi:membrane protein YdbS with pleckstrin-like domain
MRCPACGVVVHDADDFCRRCGARILNKPGVDRADDPGVDAGRTRFSRPGGSHEDETEEILWEGTYSVIAMFRELLTAMALSIAMPIVTTASNDPSLQRWIVPAIALVWILFLSLVIYRKLDVWYRMTNQRLFHEDGILYRRINRIEIIDIDDLRCEQGLVERLLGVGRIVVRSSDDSHPVLIMRGLKRVRFVFELLDRSRRRERMRHGLHVEAL